MNQGKLIQIGRPEEVYLHPQNDFARDFLGISNQFTDMRGKHICCRPEELEFVDNGTVKGIVKQEEFLGFYRQYYVETETHENIIVRTDRRVKKEVGKEIQLQVKQKIKKDIIYQKLKILIEEYLIYSGTYTAIKADVPEFFYEKVYKT